MYNFLGLTNDVIQRLNEVPLTPADFNSASGFYADVKGYVNSAINKINTEEFEWPFNHNTETQTLVVDQLKYPYPADAKTIAYDTFRLRGDDSLGVTSKKLRVLDYEEYLTKYPDHEFNPTKYHDEPSYIVRNRDLTFSVCPPPDQTYQIVYDYYSFPEDLENWDDVPSVPQQFRWLILQGALSPAYFFRGALEESAAAESMFKNGLKDMRKLYINRTEYVRSSVVRS